jgi:hypothetical protein
LRVNAKVLRTGIVAALLAALVAALAIFPLTDHVGYESAFAFSYPAAILGAWLGARAVGRARRGSGSDGARAEAAPLRTLAGWALGAWLRGALILLLPFFGLLVLGAVRRACAPLAGAIWFAVLPATTLAVGAVTGVLARLVARRAWLAGVLIAIVMISSLLHAVWRVIATPAVFAHDPYGGWLAGPIYDDVLQLSAPVLWARTLYLCAAFTALVIAACFLDEQMRISWRAVRGRGRLALLALAGLAVCTGLVARRAQLGIAISAEAIARQLGARVESEHFVLHFSTHGPWARDIVAHAADAEAAWSQLADLTGGGATVHLAPDRRVHAFLFDSAAQKRALTGAGPTQIAKPWRNEIYLSAEGYPHPSLRHELAHVFFATVGDRLFGISRRGLGVNVGLIEGAATAVAWARVPLDPHETARVLLDAKMLPPLQSLMSPRFHTLNSAIAYSAAGSFCRWLLDTRGAERFAKLYKEGGSDDGFVAIYGEAPEKLEAGWRTFLASEAVQPPASDAAVMMDHLRRPAIARRRCAHEIAGLARQAASAAAAGDREAAISAWRRVCADEPDDPSHLQSLAEAQIAANRPIEARATLERLRKHPKLSATTRARVAMLLGDLALAISPRHARAAEAVAAYDSALAGPLDAGARRLATLKRLAADDAGELGDALRDYITSASTDATLTAVDAALLGRRVPSSALGPYLLGKQLEQHNRPLAAARLAATALDGTLPDALFVEESLRMAIRNFLRAGSAEAAPFIDRLVAHQPRAAAEASDWRARLAFDKRAAGK